MAAAKSNIKSEGGSQGGVGHMASPLQHQGQQIQQKSGNDNGGLSQAQLKGIPLSGGHLPPDAQVAMAQQQYSQMMNQIPGQIPGQIHQVGHQIPHQAQTHPGQQQQHQLHQQQQQQQQQQPQIHGYPGYNDMLQLLQQFLGNSPYQQQLQSLQNAANAASNVQLQQQQAQMQQAQLQQHHQQQQQQQQQQLLQQQIQQQQQHQQHQLLNSLNRPISSQLNYEDGDNLHSRYLENEIIKTFQSKQELVKFVKTTLNDEEQCRIVINSSKPKAIYFQCERSGSFRTTVKDSAKRQRVAYTKRNKCAYRLVANLYPPDKERRKQRRENTNLDDKLNDFENNPDSEAEIWILRMINPNHNHAADPPTHQNKKKRTKSSRVLVEKPMGKPSAPSLDLNAQYQGISHHPQLQHLQHLQPGAGQISNQISGQIGGQMGAQIGGQIGGQIHQIPSNQQMHHAMHHPQNLQDPDVLAAITSNSLASGSGGLSQPPVDPAIDPNVDPNVQDHDHMR